MLRTETEDIKVMGTTTAVIDNTQRFDFALRDKTEQEMDAVLSRYLPSFYRHALRHLGNIADAEDAVQDALLSALVDGDRN
jgi:DNA-directed RNA polymerase specialized sigma24 family protein